MYVVSEQSDKDIVRSSVRAEESGRNDPTTGISGSNKNVSWDSYQGYQVYNPSVAEIVYTAGSVRMVGQMLQG